MTKKRFLAMLLTGAMTLSLAACGGTSTGSDAGTDSGADSGSDSYKIALIAAPDQRIPDCRIRGC